MSIEDNIAFGQLGNSRVNNYYSSNYTHKPSTE